MEAIHGHQNQADRSLSKIKPVFSLTFHLSLGRFHFRLIHIVVLSLQKLFPHHFSVSLLSAKDVHARNFFHV